MHVARGKSISAQGWAVIFSGRGPTSFQRSAMWSASKFCIKIAMITFLSLTVLEFQKNRWAPKADNFF